MRVRTITEMQFNEWDPCRKVIAHDHARRFGSVAPSRSPHEFALSWRSEIVDPVVVVGGRSETWLSIDQYVACISDDGRIVLALGLGSFALDMGCFPNYVVVLCETEALVFNNDYSIRAVRSFTAAPEELIETNGQAIISFDDGHQELIE